MQRFCRGRLFHRLTRTSAGSDLSAAVGVSSESGVGPRCRIVWRNGFAWRVGAGAGKSSSWRAMVSPVRRPGQFAALCQHGAGQVELPRPHQRLQEPSRTTMLRVGSRSTPRSSSSAVSCCSTCRARMPRLCQASGGWLVGQNCARTCLGLGQFSPSATVMAAWSWAARSGAVALHDGNQFKTARCGGMTPAPGKLLMIGGDRGCPAFAAEFSPGLASAFVSA